MYREPFFCSILKSSFAWPKYDEPKGSNVLIILLYKEYPTLAKHNSFITGSNVFRLNDIKSSDKMNNQGK